MDLAVHPSTLWYFIVTPLLLSSPLPICTNTQQYPTVLHSTPNYSTVFPNILYYSSTPYSITLQYPPTLCSNTTVPVSTPSTPSTPNCTQYHPVHCGTPTVHPPSPSTHPVPSVPSSTQQYTTQYTVPHSIRYYSLVNRVPPVPLLTPQCTPVPPSTPQYPVVTSSNQQ